MLFAALSVLLAAPACTPPAPQPVVLVAWEHPEVGSGSTDNPDYLGVIEGGSATFKVYMKNADAVLWERSDDGQSSWRTLYRQPSSEFFYAGNYTSVATWSFVVDYERDNNAWIRVTLLPKDARAEALVGPSFRLLVNPQPVIDDGPSDLTVTVHMAAEFSVQARRANAYRWQRSEDGGVTPLDLGNWWWEGTATLRLEDVQFTDDGALFRVVIDGHQGTRSLTSRWARLQVRALPPIVFTDTTFADGAWALETLQVGTGGTASAMQSASEGDPGAWRNLNLQLFKPAADTPSALYALNWKQDARYDPRVSGAVVAIDYAETGRRLPAGAEQTTALIARQAGHLYYAAAAGVTASTWSPSQRTSLKAGDFSLLSGADASRKLDFGSSAEPIDFGFLRAVNVGAGGAATQAEAGIDNWSVTVWR